MHPKKRCIYKANCKLPSKDQRTTNFAFQKLWRPPEGPAASCPPTDCTAVLSAMGRLTSGFGMGPGVAAPLWQLGPPGAPRVASHPGGRIARRPCFRSRLPRPAPERGIARRARPISTARLSASRRLQLRPINLVVYEGPYRKED